MRRLQINPFVNIFAMKQSSENTNERLWTCRSTELHYQKVDVKYLSVSEAEVVAEAQSLNNSRIQRETKTEQEVWTDNVMRNKTNKNKKTNTKH